MIEIFAYPKFLWFLLYGLALGWVSIRWLPKKRGKMTALLIENPSLRRSLALDPKKDLRPLKGWILAAALGLIVLALVGPQWGLTRQEQPAYGGNLVFALDISDSMLAQDIKPSRIERAKLEIAESFLKNKGLVSRFALVTFAGKAYLQCPLTLDPNALRFMMEMAAPGSLPYSGTNIADALKTAGMVLEKTSGTKDILLITDGEDHEGDVQTQAKTLARLGIRVSALWVGSPQGEPIALRDENGNFLGYKKDKEGETVVTRARGGALEEVAKMTGGRFVSLQEGYDVRGALKEILEGAKGGSKKGQKMALQNRFQIPLVFGFLLMLIEFVLPDRRR